MDRNNVFIGQDIQLEFQYIKNGTYQNVFQANKVRIYNNLDNAMNDTAFIYEITIINNPSTGLYTYTIPREYLKIEGIMYDRIFYIPENAFPEESKTQNFFLRNLPDVLPGNALSIEYPNTTTFKNVNGEVSFAEYSSDLAIYADFDINTDAKYAIINTNVLTTGTPVITSGGAYGNYVELTNASVKFGECNVINYNEGTIDTKLKLGFDNGFTYQEFLSSPIDGSVLLENDQKPANAIFYASYNNSINANWANGTTTATSVGSASYLPGGGKFGGLLDLIGNKYITYSSTNNVSINEGTVSFWLKPYYSGSPLNDQTLIKIHNGSTTHNALIITHSASGMINVSIFSNTNTVIMNQDFGNFAPNENQLYNFEFNFDIITGTNRLFIDGMQLGVTNIDIGTRTNTLAKLQIGGTANNNFGLDELLIYDRVSHTADFIPSNIENNPVVPIQDTYTFKLKVGGIYVNSGNDINIIIQPTDSFQMIADSITNNINNAVASVVNDKIRITATNINQSIIIETPTSGNSLIVALQGIGSTIIPNGPSSDNIIIQLWNEIDNKNRICLIHTTKGEFILRMYDFNGLIKINENLGVWSSVSNNWYNLVLCFNDNIAQLYIDGVQFGKTLDTKFTRNDKTKVIIASNTLDSYGFDEFKYFLNCRFFKNYTPDTFALTRYPQNNPYFILNWGKGVKIPTSISVIGTAGVKIIPTIDNVGYYYLGGDWIVSDGSYIQSTTLGDFESNYPYLPFDEQENFKIKVYFHSDGLTQVALSKLFLNLQPSLKPDYSPVINWVRGKLGEPIIPIELTDGQIDLCVGEALAKWEYYRNFSEDFMLLGLEGNSKTGYKIPQGWEKFHDIYFTPKSPISVLANSAGFGGNIFLQSYFSMSNTTGSGYNQLQTDFYLLMSNVSDMSITFGVFPTYKILNGRLFIYPDPGSMLKVGLVKARTPSVDEVNNDIWIKKYTLALAKIALGELRETIGTVPAGMDSMQLNGPALKMEGQAEVDRLEIEFKSKAEPLFLQFF